MCASITAPLVTRALAKAVIGISCTFIVVARAKQRRSRDEASSAPPNSMEGGMLLDTPAGVSITGSAKATEASAAAALIHVQALPSFTKLISSQADAYHAVEPAVQVDAVQSFCGTWAKDPSNSEPMDSFCDLFGVPRFLRQATRLMHGLELRILGDTLTVKQVCKIGFMSTTEIYPLDGVHSSAQRRRDMRPGKQLGKLLSAVEGQLQLRVAFDGWLPGEALDTLHLQEDGNTLVVQHKASIVGKGSAHFQEVYRRKN